MKFVLSLLVLCPLAAQIAELEQGKAVFRSNCTFCHGLTSGDEHNPSLMSKQLQQGSTDDDLKKVIRAGVPGTTMPAFENMELEEIDLLIRFIRHLGRGNVRSAPVAGDVTLGRQVYDKSGCAGCHRVAGEGSIYGPELTRVGAGRSQEYIHESLLQPSADTPEEYQGVTVVTKDGARITGMRVNEDTFTVQLREPSQRFRMFDKSEVKEVTHEAKSLMPDYTNLPKQDLQNLLAYLDSLRGEVKAGAGVKKAEGIR